MDMYVDASRPVFLGGEDTARADGSVVQRGSGLIFIFPNNMFFEYWVGNAKYIRFQRLPDIDSIQRRVNVGAHFPVVYSKSNPQRAILDIGYAPIILHDWKLNSEGIPVKITDTTTANKEEKNN